MAVGLTLTEFNLGIVFGTLLAIVYSLHVLFRLEKHIEKLEESIKKIAEKVLHEEKVIERRISRKKHR